jgi:hypothetical protein
MIFYKRTINYPIFKTVLPAIIWIVLISCSEPIDPFSEKDSNYSFYGPLYLETSPSYVRVHDTRSPLNAESTRELDVALQMKDLSTGEISTLEDSVKLFNEIYTHNFEIARNLNYDNRYRFRLEDAFGFIKEFTSVTTRRTEITILKDVAKCEEPLEIELINLDLTSGEEIRAEAAVNVNNQWFWSKRRPDQIFFENSGDGKGERLNIIWTPNSISRAIFGDFSYPTCDEFTSYIIRFRVTHIGYVEKVSDDGRVLDQLLDVDPIRVVSTYSVEGEFRMDPSVFQ